MSRITCPSAMAMTVLAALLDGEGFPTVSFRCPDTGIPTVCTLAPSVTVKSAIETTESITRTRAPYRTGL